MINELFDTRYGIQSRTIYLNDTNVVQDFINAFILKIEINTCFYNSYVDLILFADEKLFKYSISKTVQELTPMDTIRIVLEDKDHNIIDRRFNYVTSKDLGSDPTQGNAYYIMYRDMYGYVFTNCEFTKYITAHGYSGLPIDIIKQAIVDALTPVIEINKTRKEKSKKLDTKIFNTKIPQNRSIYDHFAMDKTIQQNFEELMDMYNIKLFQDFDTIHLWQNTSLDQLTQIDDKDGTELYSEEVSSLYANKICDRVKMPTNANTLSRINFKAFRNVQGIHHEMQTLAFDDFLPMITMNNNADKYRRLRQTMDSSSSNITDTLENLVRKSFDKYINNNTLIIYVRPFFKNINVGTKVSVRIHANTEFTGDQMEGDLEYNGNWLIVQSTVCNIGQHLICRLLLKRFDNMQRTETSMNTIDSSVGDSSAYAINIPKNAQSDNLSGASRINLDQDLQDDIENRISQVGSNSTNMQQNNWNKVDQNKQSIYRVKNKDGVISKLKQGREKFLEGKRDALLQVKRIKNGIAETATTINSVAQDINSTIQTAVNTVNDVKATVANVKNEVKHLKQFYSLQAIKQRVLNQVSEIKSEALNELALGVNDALGTHISSGELERLLKNKSFNEILERELATSANDVTALSNTIKKYRI